MCAREKTPDPLHDGSVASYIGRFVICFILGLFGDLLFMVAMRFVFPRLIFEMWLLWLIFPVACGVAGIFAFDRVVRAYERWHESFISQNR